MVCCECLDDRLELSLTGDGLSTVNLPRDSLAMAGKVGVEQSGALADGWRPFGGARFELSPPDLLRKF